MATPSGAAVFKFLESIFSFSVGKEIFEYHKGKGEHPAPDPFSQWKEEPSVKGGESFERVKAFAKAVEAAGGRALLVGGWVRDNLMGISSKDYDIEIYNLDPQRLRELAASLGEVEEMGAMFGVLKIRSGDSEFDISLPRRESKTGTGHRDFSVSADPFLDVKEAARRRDFTINSLAQDILTGEIYDYFGGMRDIEQRILRVTDEDRFREDPLRILRGMQFVGRFGLKVDEKTGEIMREICGELKHLPKERMREEWIKLFLRSERPSRGLRAAMEWGIFHAMHPEVERLKATPQDPETHPEGDVWTHTLMVVDEAAKIVRRENLNDKDSIVVLLSAFCHDFGKPMTTRKEKGKIRSPGHEQAGIEPANTFLSSIGIESSLRDPILKLVAEHLKPFLLYSQEMRGERVTDGAMKRFAERIAPATLRQLVYVAEADYRGRGWFEEFKKQESLMPSVDYPAGQWLLRRASQLEIEGGKFRPVVRGKDLIALGFRPNPLFGEVIRAAEEMHVRGFTREEIISLIAAKRNLSLAEIADILKNQKYKEMK